MWRQVIERKFSKEYPQVKLFGYLTSGNGMKWFHAAAPLYDTFLLGATRLMPWLKFSKHCRCGFVSKMAVLSGGGGVGFERQVSVVWGENASNFLMMGHVLPPLKLATLGVHKHQRNYVPHPLSDRPALAAECCVQSLVTACIECLSQELTP